MIKRRAKLAKNTIQHIGLRHGVMLKRRARDRHKRHNKGINAQLHQLQTHGDNFVFGITQTRENISTDITSSEDVHRRLNADI